MKPIIFCFLGMGIAFFPRSFWAQNLTLNPDHSFSNVAACPETEITYTVGGIPGGCGVDIELLTPEAADFFIVSGNEFTVVWNDLPRIARVRVTANGNQCSNSEVFEIPILSISDEIPVLSQCEDLIIGRLNFLEITAELFYPIRGNNDPLEVDGYLWEVISGGEDWNIYITDQNGIENKLAQIMTDIEHGATIRVTAFSRCGLPSLPFVCTIDRFVAAPCPIQNAPEYLLCENTNTIYLGITPPIGVVGYTYEWDLPPGWSANSTTGESIAITPNGINGGTVSVTAYAFGKSSEPCTVDIPVLPIDPATEILGPDPLNCNVEGIYALSVPPPPSSNIFWEVVPSSAVIPSSGSGMFASFIVNSVFSGQVTLKFQIQTLCGTETREKTFFIGTPLVTNVVVDGEPGTFVYVCPTEGSHYIQVDLIGDPDNCVDEWDDFGTTGTSVAFCDEFDFTLQYNPNNYPPYNSVFVNVISRNDCGIGSQNVVVIPSYFACDKIRYKLEISPNPAQYYLNARLLLVGNEVEESLPIELIQLIDQNGKILLSRTGPNQEIQLDVSNLKPGTYYLRIPVEHKFIIEPLVIHRSK